MTGFLWTIIPFVILCIATTVLCVIWKKKGTPDGTNLRAFTCLSVIACHFYVVFAALVWEWIWLSNMLGYGWAVAINIAFWAIPWFNGVKPISVVAKGPFQAAMNFVDSRLDGWGFQRFDGMMNNDIFVVIGKEERKAMAEIMDQIKPQMRDQVKNPIRRWLMLHWRWYDPLVGGYCCFSHSMAEQLDNIIHNTYGFPISRRVSLFAPTPFAGVNIVEVNT